MRKSLVSLLIACVCATSAAWAERVSQEDAATVANHFMNVKAAQTGAKKAPAKRMVLMASSAAQSDEPQYYIYQNANGEGWVMVAANDVVRPILAYSHTGQFRTDNMPRNVKGWLQGYERQIRYAAQNNTQASASVKREWKKLRSGVCTAQATTVVAPLIQTGWDQTSPFWNDCPMKGGERCYVGCVATAMAQVMNYWQWPVTGVGSNTVTVSGTNYTVDFTTGNYDWANMTNTYSSSSTSAQKAAVAKLMYHCGVAVSMQYGTYDEGGSAAYTINWKDETMKCAQNALVQNFGYKSTTVKSYYRDGWSGYYSSWTKANWIAMLKTELDASRPIMYAGGGIEDEQEYGHSFVCDGYDSNNYFHFNWGWGNWCDGFYDVDALDTEDPGSGGGNGSYNLKQDVIIGIRPNLPDVPVTGVTVAPTSLTLKIKERAELTATVLPNDASVKTVSWSSSNPSVAKVSSSGVVTGLSAGTATITVTTSDGNKTATCAVTVTNEVMPAIDLEVDYGWAEYQTSGNYWVLIVADSTTLVPWLQFYYDSGSATKIAGTYDLANSGVLLWNDPDDDNVVVQSVSGQLNVTCTGKDNGTNGCNTYHITASFVGDDDLDYTLDVTLELCGQDDGSPATPIDLTDEVGDGAPKQITWMANGVEFTTTICSGSIEIPASEPSPCEGKAFMGWTAIENYEHASIAPTYVENGDAYSVDTYYAVYATPGQGGALTVEKATSIAVGDRVVFVCEDAAKEMTSINSWGVGTAYSGTPAGTYIFDVVEGSSSGKVAFENDDSYIAWSSGNSLELSETLNSNSSWTVTFGNNGRANIANANTSGRIILWNVSSPRFAAYEGKSIGNQYYAIQLYKVSGGTSYSDYTTSCVAPEPVYYNVRFYDKGVQVGETQSVLKNTQAQKPDDPEACDGYTFVGWWGSVLPEDNTTSYTWTTDFTATQDTAYYAIYSHTETEGGGESTDVTFTAGTDTSNSLTISKGGVTITVTDGTLSRDDNYRCYANHTMTVSSTSAMSSIVMNCNESGTTKGGPGCFSASGYTYNGTVGTWTGDATSVTFSASKQVQINSMTVTLGAAPASTTYYSSVACGSTTDIEETSVIPAAQKLLLNGQIVIIRGDAVYTVTGVRIK